MNAKEREAFAKERRGACDLTGLARLYDTADHDVSRKLAEGQDERSETAYFPKENTYGRAKPVKMDERSSATSYPRVRNERAS